MFPWPCVLLAGQAMAGLGQQLRSDHVRLGRVFEQLLEAAERGDQGAVGEMWAALREEHAKIREMLARAAGAGATPTLSRQAAAELEATVSKHARREDGLLYCLADAASDEELSRSLRDYMDRTYSALRHLPADD
jgi:hypothetical protein